MWAGGPRRVPLTLLLASRSFMRRFSKWLCFLVLGSTMAAAEASNGPGVMPFPLELKRVPTSLTAEEREGLQREYTRLLRVSGAKVPDFAHYDLALSELKRQDCEHEDECLQQLSKKASSLYAVYASLDLTVEGVMVVSARVVRDDGKLVRPTRTVQLKNEGLFTEDANKAFEQVFALLDLNGLPSARPVEVVEKQTLIPKVTASVDTGAGQRTVGLALFITGIAGAAAGGALIAGGQGLGGSLSPTQLGNLPPEQLISYRSARTLSNAGLIALAAGGATAAAGGLLWALAPKERTGVGVSVAAAPGVAMISLRGNF